MLIDFYEELKYHSKLGLKFGYIYDIKKAEVNKILERLSSGYFYGIICDLKFLIKYGSNFISSFLSKIFRNKLNSFLFMPLYMYFNEDDFLKFIINLGFDGLILNPNFISKNILEILNNERIKVIFHLNENMVITEKYKAVFTINASLDFITKLKKLNIFVINKGENKGDMEVLCI